MRRLSLHVGINYPGTSAALAGCVADARGWKAAAAQRGYIPNTLIDHEATKANIVQHMGDDLASLAMGDRYLFTFSGHGSYVADRGGDEVDGRDEVLCASDYQDRGLITDDELYEIVQARKLGVVVTIISDSCHSGTVSRFVATREWHSSVFGPQIEDRRSRFLPPDQFLDGPDLAAARKVEYAVARGRSRPGATLIAACRDDQVAWDASFDGYPMGAFSRAALLTLPQEKRTRDWVRETHRMIDQARTPQAPQLTAGPWQALRKPLR